jgi:hypothetical protein
LQRRTRLKQKGGPRPPFNRRRRQRPPVAVLSRDYLFFPGAGTERAGGTTDDEAGTDVFFGCFGFLVSLLLRC